MKTKLIIAATALVIAAPALATQTLAQRIEQVNKEDMRVKSGVVSGDTLTLRVEDMERTQGRREIYGKDVNIDVSSLKGRDGNDGMDGVSGAKGVDGAAGQDGRNGSAGAQGERGSSAVLDAAIKQRLIDVDEMRGDLSAGIASAVAAGQHQFDPGFSGGQVSLTGGYYNGENAVSFAVGVPLGNRAFFHASITEDSGSFGASGGVGVTIQLAK